MPLTFEEVSRIVAILDSSSCDELVVETGDTKLVVRRRGAAGQGGAGAPPPAAPTPVATAAGPEAAPAGTPAPPRPPTPAPAPAPGGHPAHGDALVEVCAPMVGTFYATPSPNDPPFVTAGDMVEKGQPLCLIEVMKLFTTIYADQPGRIAQVLPTNGELVQHGQPLFLIEPR